MPDLRQRLLRRSEKRGACRVWNGSRFPNGYGRITVGSIRDGSRRTEGVHRVAFREFVGPIPDGLGVLHSCDNKPCIEPTHLFLGTDLDNARDRDAKGRARPALGSRNGQASRTDLQVMAIRWLIAEGLGRSAVAQRFGIAVAEVSRICKGQRWGHLPVLPYPERRGGYWHHAGRHS